MVETVGEGSQKAWEAEEQQTQGNELFTVTKLEEIKNDGNKLEGATTSRSCHRSLKQFVPDCQTRLDKNQ